MLPTQRAGGVEAPERALEAFSLCMLARPAMKNAVPHFVQIHPKPTYEVSVVVVLDALYEYLQEVGNLQQQAAL